MRRLFAEMSGPRGLGVMLRTIIILASVNPLSCSAAFVLHHPARALSHSLALSTTYQKSGLLETIHYSKISLCRSRVSIIASVLPFKEALVVTEVDTDIACVLSESEALALAKLSTHALGAAAGTYSVDLGKRHLEGLVIATEGISLPGAAAGSPVDLTWDDLKRIAKNGGAWRCYWGAAGYEPSRIDGFSELTGRSASLYPVDGSLPTVVLGGFGMHRFAKDASPRDDTELKLAALGPRLRGSVLDVCTGLGYTAIGAASKAGVDFVATLELDPLLVRIQDANPWSAELRGEKIERYLGDAIELLPRIPDASFDAICHDPPAQSMSGELYAEEVYAHFARILKPSGALYHYIGDPDSKASGKLFKGVAERMRAAGLEPSVVREAYGIAAVKKQR